MLPRQLHRTLALVLASGVAGGCAAAVSGDAPGTRGFPNGVCTDPAPMSDWTPAEPCRRLAETARATGEPGVLKIYPGAHHSFDSANPVRYVPTRINPSSPTGRGATTGGNAEAWSDSIREVAAFFDRHLAPPLGPAPR